MSKSAFQTFTAPEPTARAAGSIMRRHQQKANFADKAATIKQETRT